MRRQRKLRIGGGRSSLGLAKQWRFLQRRAERPAHSEEVPKISRVTVRKGTNKKTAIAK